jgi:hypothetical protein
MTTAPVLTVAHGGTRRGDTMLCTPDEYHDLESLRAMRRDLYALTGSAVTSVSVVDLLYVLDGE